MAFRNNKSIFVPESKKTDIYEAAGVSRRTYDRVEGVVVVGESTKGDPAGLAGWPVQRRRAEVKDSSFLSSFFFPFLFLFFYNLIGPPPVGGPPMPPKTCVFDFLILF